LIFLSAARCWEDEPLLLYASGGNPTAEPPTSNKEHSRSTLALRRGAVLTRVPLFSGSDDKKVVAKVDLKEGEDPRHSASQVCRSLSLDEGNCQMVHKGLHQRYTEERERRLKVLQSMTPREAAWAYRIREAINEHTLSQPAMPQLFQELHNELGQRGGGVAMYHAMDALHGWEGNGGDHHPGLQIGYVSPPQLPLLHEVAGNGPLQLCEVGFNAGHSATQFLTANPLATLLSFDLVENDYVQVALTAVATLFPGRHQLRRGSSALTVPQFHAEQPAFQCNVIFVDGDHTFEGAWADLKNMAQLAPPGATVAVDDMDIPGVIQAWEKAIAECLITPEPHQNMFRGKYQPSPGCKL